MYHSDFAELKRRVREARLLGLQPGRSSLGIGIKVLVLALCWIAVVRFHQQPWVVVLGAVALGVMSTQLGFVVHDAGHHQLFARAWKNRLAGFLSGNVLIGMSFAWWVDKHTRHHVNPNHMDMDPDVNNVALAYSTAQALARPPLLRWVARYQAFLFFPLICFTALSTHVGAMRYLVFKRRLRGVRLDMGLLVLHATVYLGLLLLLFGPWGALLFVLLQKATTGVYMALVIAPNHQGMLQTDGSTELDFLRKQVLTARNVHSNWLTDLVYGSLNLQIEHHLFPRMTRSNLPRARLIVRQFCAERGVLYHETSVPQAVRELVGALHRVGAPLRKPARAGVAVRRPA